MGETAVVTKILSYQNPPFGQVIVIYCDGGSTQKYDDLENVEVISEIPALRIEGTVETLVILDDLEFKLKKVCRRSCCCLQTSLFLDMRL